MNRSSLETGTPSDTGGARRSLASWIRLVALPKVNRSSYPLSVQVILTLLVFVGLGMIFVSVLNPHGHFEALWHGSYVLGLGGLVLASVSGGLRGAKKTTLVHNDRLSLTELLCLTCLAMVIVGTGIHYSKRIGLLAFPPYYDGVEYMYAAKCAMVRLAVWKQHPLGFAFIMLGNRYPMWKALLLLNFTIFGAGEWQSFAVRFWPIFIILTTVFWVIRRRVGSPAAYAAVLFTALLPTLSLDSVSAALGYPIYPRGYLTDLRPDILFAAFVMLLVAAMIEHADRFDEWTALLVGVSAALAVLTKATAASAIVLACVVSAAYVLFLNRSDFWKTLRTMMWALLPFTILLLPWLLTGGLEITLAYVRQILTSQLPRYSNAHPTLRSESTYYWFWLIKHMGWLTVGLAAASPLFLIVAHRWRPTAKSPIHAALPYLCIAAALYGLVSATPAKNFFLGLPCYLILWIYCWISLTSVMDSLRSAKSKLSWGLLSMAIIIVGVVGIKGVQNVRTWRGNEFEEGEQDRMVMKKMAMDLRQVLSNGDTFIAMPAYGNPDTLKFYMPDGQGDFPQARWVNGINGPSIQEFIQQSVEPSKAVLVYSNGNESSSFKEYAAPEDFPYFSAIASWVQRPGSRFHRWKTYNLYPGASGDKSEVELYVRND